MVNNAAADHTGELLHVPDAEYITGITLPVDGGCTAR